MDTVGVLFHLHLCPMVQALQVPFRWGVNLVLVLLVLLLLVLLLVIVLLVVLVVVVAAAVVGVI